MVGYAGVITAANALAILSPTESPMKRNEPTGAASYGAPDTPVVSNHGAGISNVVLNVQPLTFTVDAVPLIATLVAYPFQSAPRPSCVVTTEVSVPICGYLATNCAAEITRVHINNAFTGSLAKSPASTCAGNVPPAVRPPLLLVNSVREGVPFGVIITKLAVSAIA